MLLFRVSLHLHNTKCGKCLYNVLEDLGIRILISRFFNKQSVKNDYLHPTCAMRASKDFFALNKERVRKITEWLADDLSKEVYTAMITFRQTSDYTDLPENSMRTQYFDNTFFNYKNGEVFIDCGAYDGDTIRSFKKNMKKRKIRKYTVVAFEPEIHNFKNLKRNCPQAIAINAGVWDSDTKLFFSSEPNSSICSEVSSQICQSVEVRALDHCDEAQAATFIKMDIEGAEMNALRGARTIIQKNKPKLAICIYHSDEDMLRLAEWIHETVPEYKLYVRQHSNCICETVLYAVL